MKNKLIGIIICMLLIGTVLPVTGVITVNEETNVDDEIQATLDYFFRNPKFEYVNKEVLVQFSEEFPSDYIDVFCEKYDLELIEHISFIDWYHLRITTNENVGEKLYSLLLNPYVQFAEPNGILYGSSVGGLRKPRHLKTPNDPFYPHQWGLNNYGVNPAIPTGKIDADIDAPQAWEHLTESKVLVAVLDSGVDYTHPDISPNIWVNADEILDNGDTDGNGYIDDIRGWDFVDNDNDPMDFFGHGTHCAGIIGAVGNNGIGIAGICWSPRFIIPVRVLDRENEGSWSNLANGINYSLDNGAKIISMSFGGPGGSLFVQQAIQKANTKKVLVVAAAGNNGKNVDIDPVYPCCYPENNIIGVATSDNQDNPASWSNNGVASVDIFAPGVDILSLGMHNSYIGHNAIYRDVNNPGKVSAGDIRLTNYTLPGMKHGVVNADDGDVGFPLKKFGDLERHTENIDTNNRYDHGEYIYNDTDNTGTVTKGDFRLMWMEWRGTWYRTGSIVWTGDEDLQTPRIPLFDFIDDETYAIYAYMNGTSMATPHVSGALAHFWSLFPNLEHTQVKDWLMRITRVDPRPNLDNMVHYGKNRDARLRMICGDDFGDAKDTYTGDNHKYPVKERYTGGGHEDIGEEWLGNITESGDVTPEFDADLKYPYDVDKTHSNNEPRRKPDNPEPPYQKTCSVWDKDSYDDGIKIENPLIIGGTNTIKYSIMTENEDIVDSEGGRYRGTDKTNVYINIWIDWNNDGDWEDTNEHVWRKSHNPTAEWKGEHCSGWLPASFIVPHDLENGIYNLRARLDYGEDVGKYKLYDSDDALVRSFGLAQYGEVEDYCVRVMHPLVRTREKFEMFPPDDWEELVYNGDGHWEATKDALYPPYGWSGSCFIAANSHVHPDKIYDVELFTPPIDMTGFEAVALECDGNMQNPLGVEGIAAINIYSGVDKVLEWQPYFSMGDPDVGGMHHAYTFAPGSYTDPSHVQIGFYYSTAGATDAYNFAVDNLNISDAMGDTIFFDDFNGYCDAVGFPPDGWELVQTTEEVTDGHPCYWHGSDYMAGEGQYSAGLWWGTQLQDEWLISPTIDLSGDISGAFLDFWTYNYGYSQSFWEGDYVKVSTNGGITWDKLGNLYEEAQAYPSGFLGERVQYDLSDYVGRSNLQIAFHRYTVESYPNLGFWFIDDFIIYVIPSSEPPNTPVISGPTTGSPGNEYTYSISLIDPENDDVFLYVDWDDGNIIDWFGSFDSGETAEIGHTWDEKGTYIIKAKVKDFYNAESDWGTLTVTMPRNRAININSLFLRFLEHFPILQKILCYIL